MKFFNSIYSYLRSLPGLVRDFFCVSSFLFSFFLTGQELALASSSLFVKHFPSFALLKYSRREINTLLIFYLFRLTKHSSS